MRLFLMGNAVEWHRASLHKLSLESKWIDWRNSFLKTYGDKSWRFVQYAYTYRYIKGSYLDYALKKERLLLETDTQMSVRSRINHIVVGLPSYIQDKLDKEVIVSTELLMNQLRRYSETYHQELKTKLNIKESPAELERSNSLRNHKPQASIGNPQSHRKACSYCSSAGFPNRYHPEDVCRTKKNIGVSEKSVYLAEPIEEENVSKNG